MSLPVGTKLKPTRALELLNYANEPTEIIGLDESKDYIVYAPHIKDGKDYFFRDDLDFFFEVIV